MEFTPEIRLLDKRRDQVVTEIKFLLNSPEPDPGSTDILYNELANIEAELGDRCREVLNQFYGVKND